MDLGTSKRGVILITSGGDFAHGSSGVSLRILSGSWLTNADSPITGGKLFHSLLWCS
jgi:hypothetical protein